MASTPDDVLRLAESAPTWRHLDGRVQVCRACPRLVAWREEVATVKRAQFQQEPYWGRGVASLGDNRARVVIVGLAPAAHGANRTGRVFTGDRSGDWLFAALHRAGLASQAESTAADDGLKLVDTRIMMAAHCAPPQNKLTPEELATCRPWLESDVKWALPHARSFLALGNVAWRAMAEALREHDIGPRRWPGFGHGVECDLGDGRIAIASYHPSQQNTFTGRLTEVMLDTVIQRAAEHARG